MNPLTLWKNKKLQNLKERILKNREGVLDVMSENIKGAKQCPFLIGQKCIGGMCEFFMEFDTTDAKTGEKLFTYHRCSFVQTPLLLIEVARELRKIIDNFQFAAKE